MKTTENTQWLNLLRALATFAVIVLHVCVPILNSYGTENQSHWLTGLVTSGFTRFCVPMFLVISGVLLLGKNYDLKIFLKKRLSRIILPFVFWSLIYYLINANYNHNFTQIVFDFFKAIKSGTSYHLWYVYMLIGVYLIFPIINKWLINAEKNEVKFYLIVWVIAITILLPYFNKLYSNIDLRYFSGYLGYTILGFYLNKYVQITSRFIYLILYFFASFVGIVLTYFFTRGKGSFDGVFFAFLTPNVVLATVSLFLFFKNFQIRNKLLIWLSENITRYSYGIYLSHVLILSLLEKSKLFINLPTFLYILSVSVIILISSFLLTYIINKIPLFGKFISG